MPITVAPTSLMPQINRLQGATGFMITGAGTSTYVQLVSGYLVDRDLAISGVLQDQLGLAGVLSLNSKVAVVSIAGAGGLSVVTPIVGQTIFVSGDQSISGALTATGVVLGAKIDALSGRQQFFETSVPTGIDTQFISFSPPFTTVPHVLMSLQTNGVNYMVGQTGIGLNGYYATFSDVLLETGAILTTFAKL